MDKIEKAYEQDLIDPFSIEPDDFEYALGLGKESALGRIKKDMERRLSEDIHERISWWACFKRKNEKSNMPLDTGHDYFVFLHRFIIRIDNFLEMVE